ncbi:MAG: hypothetical protein IPF48_14150 [Sphingomonadales bacterium]|nr:hypothetical protein [Sphingomonadales bacterium]
MPGLILTASLSVSEGSLGIITQAWMKLQGRVVFRANATITFDTFYRLPQPFGRLPQAGLFPANCRYLTRKMPSFMALGDGTQNLCCQLAFASADHPVDVWLERGAEISQTLPR